MGNDLGLTITELALGEAADCESILRRLPEWFGIESAIRSYRKDAEEMETYVTKSNEEILGFITIKTFMERSAEIQVLGVMEEFHRQGIGRGLVLHVEETLVARGIEYLQVKTLGPSRPDEYYQRTRSFYEAMGFCPLEETTTLWGPENPTLLMVKRL